MNDEEKAEIPPGQEVPKLFAQWRSPRFGKSNPEKLSNPVWEWMIQSRVNAFQANERFKGPSPFDAGPGWSFDRHGRSETTLPDGRVVFIAGEHEDSYDPDFYIYNDVVVQNRSGKIDIYGYPKESFAPTDFHSATLVVDRIIVIGSLGYDRERKAGFTPVYELNLKTFQIKELQTSGTPPGWIHMHKAVHAAGKIQISGGLIETGNKNEGFIENVDDWTLDLTTLQWRRGTQRNWEQWEFRRADGEMNNLWQIRSAEMMRKAGLGDLQEKMMKETAEKFPVLKDSFKVPKTSVADLYRPSIEHEVIPENEEEHNVFRIRVNGVTVRFVEEMRSVKMVIEGELGDEKVKAMTDELAQKLGRAEETEYTARRVR